jgi:Xaa-Pro aminopeptidase
VALDHPLHEMRLFKSRSELASMRRAAEIACAAHRRAAAVAAPGRMEYEVMAEILHEFHRRRADISYHPIVGSGPNSCVLHYRDNARQMKEGELLLIDAGCEYQYYASDVTRTLPVGGRYRPRQRAIYEVVLEANRAATAKARAGNHWNDPHDAAVRVITQGLRGIGLLKGSLPRLIRDGAYRKFFMHRVGHWLGMDVHDVGEYKVGEQWRMLEAGMVTTIEPGIYIAPGTPGVRREWWGIGVRLEDDVAVTTGAPEVLTEAMPKDPDEIERLMAAA